MLKMVLLVLLLAFLMIQAAIVPGILPKSKEEQRKCLLFKEKHQVGPTAMTVRDKRLLPEIKYDKLKAEKYLNGGVYSGK